MIQFILLGCYKNYSTEEEFKFVKYGSIMNKNKDSIQINDSLRYMVDNNMAAFYPDNFDHEAKIQISRILYSPDESKFAVFVTVETKVSKDKYLTELDVSYSHNYYSTIFTGKKKSKQIEYLEWLPLINVGSNSNFDYATTKLDEVAFEKFSRMRNQKGEHYYNLDDIRFWEYHHWD